MAATRRFLYTQTNTDNSQALKFAELQGGEGSSDPVYGRNLATIVTVPGDPPAGGGIPEQFSQIVPSRTNAWGSCNSTQLGTDFIDCNVHMVNFATGAYLRVNEHSFHPNRSMATFPEFDALLASEAASGVPPAQLATYDYVVQAEGTNIGFGDMVWTEAETLLLHYRYDVTVPQVGASFDDIWFEFEVDPGNGKLLSVNAGLTPPTPPPANHFGLTPGPKPDGGRVALDGTLLPFRSQHGCLGFMIPYITYYEVADAAAGRTG